MSTRFHFTSEEDFDQDEVQELQRTDTRRPYARMTRKMAEEARSFKRAQAEFRTDFQFTYQPARFEEWWLLASLSDFYEHGWITDVLRRVKSGKEASVYQCRAGKAAAGELAAAKVYRPWSLRNMRNDVMYRQGRIDLDDQGHEVLDGGQLHAIQQKTAYGRELLQQSWMAYEFTSLQALRAAGADVPEPYAMGHNAILMEFVGDRQRCAPTLNEVALSRDEAKVLFGRVMQNIEILLSREKVHGDLSAYNILYWNGRITLIDFPQIVSLRENAAAFAIFQRDVSRICEYFGRQGVRVDGRQRARQMWESHGYLMPGGPENT